MSWSGYDFCRKSVLLNLFLELNFLSKIRFTSLGVLHDTTQPRRRHLLYSRSTIWRSRGHLSICHGATRSLRRLLSFSLNTTRRPHMHLSIYHGTTWSSCGHLLMCHGATWCPHMHLSFSRIAIGVVQFGVAVGISRYPAARLDVPAGISQSTTVQLGIHTIISNLHLCDLASPPRVKPEHEGSDSYHFMTLIYTCNNKLCLTYPIIIEMLT